MLFLFRYAIFCKVLVYVLIEGVGQLTHWAFTLAFATKPTVVLLLESEIASSPCDFVCICVQIHKAVLSFKHYYCIISVYIMNYKVLVASLCLSGHCLLVDQCIDRDTRFLGWLEINISCVSKCLIYIVDFCTIFILKYEHR